MLDAHRQVARSHSNPKRSLISLTSIVVFVATDIVILVFWSSPFGRWSTDAAGDYLGFYAPVARNLLDGRGLVTTGGAAAIDYPPGFPWILAVLFWFARWTGMPDSIWLKGFTLAALGLTACLVYWLTERILGERRALWTAALWITCPFHLWVSRQPNSEIAFLPLLYGALCLYWLLLEPDTDRRPLGCGVLCGFAALIRPIVLFLPLVFAIGLVVTKPKEWKRSLGYSALIILGFVLIVLPWETWARARTGTLILLSTSSPRSIVDGWTFAIGRPDFRATIEIPTGVRTIMEDIAARNRRGELNTLSEVFSVIRDQFRQDPASAFHLLMWKAARAWYGTDALRPIEQYALIVQLCYLALAAAGSFVLWREPGFGRTWMIAAGLVVAYFWAMSTVALSIVRYMTPALGLLLPSAAVMLDRGAVSALALARRCTPEAGSLK